MEIKLAKKEEREKIIEFYKIVFGERIVSSLNKRMFNSPFNSVSDFSYIEENWKIIL